MTTPEEAMKSMIANYEKNTGRSLDAWVALMRPEKLKKHADIVKRLKDAHGMGHGYANLVAMEVLKGGTPELSGGDLVAAQYSGAKTALRPLYDKIAASVGKFGGDISFAPKKANVSIRRVKQFALIQPSTADRLDVGINLKGVTAKGRLENAGSFSAMVTHRVRVTSAKDIDAELVAWLRAAYEAAK